MRLNRIFPIFIALTLLVLPACFDDSNDPKDYTGWRQENIEYIKEIAGLTEEGQLVYEPLTPDWDNSFTIYIRKHENPDGNPNDLMPLSNSTCNVKYTLKNIKGELLDSSANFVCVPNQMITGFMAAVTNMKVNDTITAVIPAEAGYGSFGSGAVLPYSTLVFGIRLVSISKLM